MSEYQSIYKSLGLYEYAAKEHIVYIHKMWKKAIKDGHCTIHEGGLKIALCETLIDGKEQYDNLLGNFYQRHAEIISAAKNKYQEEQDEAQQNKEQRLNAN